MISIPQVPPKMDDGRALIKVNLRHEDKLRLTFICANLLKEF